MAALDGGVTHSIPDRPGADFARPTGVAIGRFARIRSVNPGGRYRGTVVPARAPAGINSPSARATAVAASVLFDRLISSPSSRVDLTHRRPACSWSNLARDFERRGVADPSSRRQASVLRIVDDLDRGDGPESRSRTRGYRHHRPERRPVEPSSFVKVPEKSVKYVAAALIALEATPSNHHQGAARPGHRPDLDRGLNDGPSGVSTRWRQQEGCENRDHRRAPFQLHDITSSSRP